ncbi:NADH-quinone oxidoreductase subunit B family protein [Caldithrix abyssi]|uniref:F420-non-reducing hydrogenase subunit G n=1 Tax=Caldithrix abyssi DSM 13497 TaxID=880073 RepID=H1XT83_CALAY|nr:oxidoreductase [Caldithrix abyssi]APF18664.1 F420-non-reducing hydrogenase subunit G [Caldithrix abyssi DSM 13497]EHO42650.1 NADH ubiquinone oxidoreductase 20 kDa subunit [Caldithrix abyssi DSM 13497]
MSKPKVAFYWCASCGGCEEAVVDLAENILDVVAAVDIVFWPVALDFKRQDVEQMEDREIDVTFLNGAIRLQEQEEMAKLLRQKSKLMIAFGSCSHLGGIPGLGNLWNRDEIFQRAYHEVPSMEEQNGKHPMTHFKAPEGDLELPEFFDTVRTLNQVVEVDYYLPGCPPTPKLLLQAVQAILKGELPPPGSVLAPDKALCEECPRNESKPEKLLMTDIKRPHQIHIDSEKCLLAQGIICMGPATRAGCEALCVNGNMPCTGCFGPTSKVLDQGAKALSAIASIIDYNDENDIQQVMNKIVDPVGTFYRYSLPASLLQRRNMAHLKKETAS